MIQLFSTRTYKMTIIKHNLSMSQNQEFKTLGYVAAIFGGLSFGTIPILSAILRDNNASSLEQSSIRLFFGAIIGLYIY